MSKQGAFAPELEDGDAAVDSRLVCVLTRFAVRTPLQTLQSYSDYRHVAIATVGLPGLLSSSFLFESPTTFYTLSLWRRAADIPRLGGVTAHIAAGNRVFPRLQYRQGRGAEIASTRWRLVAASNNLNWGNLDLRAELGLVER